MSFIQSEQSMTKMLVNFSEHFSLKCWSGFSACFFAPKTLAEILKRDANNLDIFRVIAAFMVIYGHSYAICPVAGRSDFIARLIGFDYSGSLAVKIFFFLSGLVVTNSLLEKNSPLQFTIARFFRIWPALIVVVILAAFLLGPIFSTYSFHEYFSNGQVYEYIYKNIIVKIAYNLPGVFTNNPYKDAVNGSLWTIPHEIFAYAMLLALFMIGLFKYRAISILIFVAIVADSLMGNKFLFTWLPQNHQIDFLASCFAFGALLATYKEKIKIDLFLPLGALLLLFLFKNSPYNFCFFYFALFIAMVYVSSLDFMIKLRPKIDISYGVYLWGFPVQQVMAKMFYAYGIRFHQISSILICAILGYLSWHLIEKRCIKFGAALGRKVKPQITYIPTTKKVANEV